MLIERLRRPPTAVTLTQGALTLYEIELNVVPSPDWRAALLRPPPALVAARYTPELVRLGFEGARVTFRAIPAKLHASLRRIDQWITYANSVVEE